MSLTSKQEVNNGRYTKLFNHASRRYTRNADADLENCEPTRLEFWATKNALKQGNPVISLKSFLFSAMGMDKVGFGEALEQCIGQTFSGVVKHEMVGRNKDILQASVSRILKAA